MPALSATVFDLVDQIAAAITVSGVWNAYLDAARSVGLKYGITFYVPPATGTPFQIVTNALPTGWVRDYYSGGLDAGDLLMERIRASKESFAWSLDDWDVAAMSSIQRRWRDHNLHYGILGGLNVMDFRRGENMLLAICGPNIVIHPHDRMVLYFAGQEAMLRLREMAVAAPMEHAPLSRRERECLQWAAQGKTDWEIGQILSLSEKTVNVYIDRAKSKYGVKTRAQAIIAALRAGAIAA